MPISVIIPVYNVEEYITDCLNSIINQTYKDLEIICVDDCGQDNSMNIVRSFAQKDNRFKIVESSKNVGLSGARNKGLEIATGEYIYFIDSDDYIDLNYLEEMLKYIEKTKTDVIVNNNILRCYLNGKTKQILSRNIPKIKKYSIVNPKDTNIIAMVWCKLYRKSFLDKINFSFPIELRRGEDSYLTSLITSLIDKITIINGPTYYYLETKTSLTATLGKSDTYYLAVIEKVFEKYKNMNVINKHKLNKLYIFIEDMIMVNQENKEYFFTELKSTCLKIKDYVLYNDLYNKNEKHLLNIIISSQNYEEFIKKYSNKLNIKLFNIPLISAETIDRRRKYKLFNFLTIFSINYTTKAKIRIKLFR